LKFVYNTLNVFLETTLRFSPTLLKVTVSKLIYMCTCNIYDRFRSAFRLKSASTPKISIHWCHYLKSRVRFKCILKSVSCPNSHIYGWFIG